MMLAAAIGLLAAIVVAAVFIFAGRFYRWRQRVLERARTEMDIFYGAAQSLLKDETVPESVSDFVARFSQEALKPTLAFRIGGRFLAGNVRSTPPTGGRAKQFYDDISELTSEQGEKLADCVAYGLLVSAASNIVFGDRIRAILIFGLFNGGQFNSGANNHPHVNSPEKAIGIAVQATPQLCIA